MGKLYFINQVRWTKEFITNRSLWEAEIARWAKIAEKHGVKRLGGGTPWGNDYHNAAIYEKSKGMDAWPKPSPWKSLEAGIRAAGNT